MINASRYSLLWKLVLPVPIMLTIGLLAAWILIPRVISENAMATATAAGTQTAAQFKTIRGYYTKNVIKKVVANGSMKPSFTHADEPNSIPLPATFIHDLSRLLAEANTSINLYSGFPFPLRNERQLDSFQQDAWAFLQQNPDEVFVRQEDHEGRQVIRVATADRMVAEGCVNCHNSHPDSPKTNWQLGDVRGILEVNTDITEQLAAGTLLSRGIVISLLICGLALTLVTCYFAKNATSPLKRIAAVMRRLADDDKTVEVTDRERRDEVGDMAETVQVFKDNAVRMELLQRENAAKDEAAEQQQKKGDVILDKPIWDSYVKGIGEKP